MKVLIVTNLYPNAREPGRGIFNKQQFDELAKLCEVKVIAPIAWRPSFRFQVSGFRSQDPDVFHPLWLAIPKIGRSLHGRFYYWGIKKLFNRLCRDWQPDVVLATWAYPDAYAVSMLLGSGGFTPSTSLGGVKPPLPLVIKVHGTDVNEGIKIAWKRRMIREGLERADAIVAVSQALKRKIYLLGICKETKVIPNGVDSGLFKPMDKRECQKKLGLNSGKKHILFVGNLVPIKGLKYLMRAVRELPDDFLLHVVGEGRQARSLKTWTIEARLEGRIHFHGRVPHNEIPIWMNAADVFCLPSLEEGCPNVIVEALACGTPVVATNVGGIPELIHSEDKGVLVEPGDEGALAAALARVLAAGAGKSGEGGITEGNEGNKGGAASPTSDVLSWADSAREVLDVIARTLPK